MLGFIVCRDGNVDEFEGCIRITESDDRNIDVRRLTDRLVVDTGVSDNNESGLLERASDVVGKATGSETTSNGLGAGVSSVLQDCTLAIGTSGNDTDVIRVLNGSNDSCCKNKFFPGLANVDNVDT